MTDTLDFPVWYASRRWMARALVISPNVLFDYDQQIELIALDYMFSNLNLPFSIWREKVRTYLSDRKCFIINNIFARGIPIPDLIGNVQTHSDVFPKLCVWICSSSDRRQEGSLLQSKVAQIVHHNAWMPRQTTLIINSWGNVQMIVSRSQMAKIHDKSILICSCSASNCQIAT